MLVLLSTIRGMARAFLIRMNADLSRGGIVAKGWVDVADTAVKIGLGSLITGVFTYIGLMLSSGSERKKYALNHKISVLEQINNEMNEYFIAAETYLGTYHGVVISRNKNGTEGRGLTADQTNKLIEVDNELVNKWNSHRVCLSKLRLLKVNKVGDLLDQYNIVVSKEIRRPLVFDNVVLNKSDFETKRKQIYKIKQDILGNLADYYESLLLKG